MNIARSIFFNIIVVSPSGPEITAVSMASPAPAMLSRLARRERVNDSRAADELGTLRRTRFDQRGSR
jgi:hypothetical protein